MVKLVFNMIWHIINLKIYFDQEIKDQELLIKKLSRYITGFDYTDKILTVFLTVFSGANIFAHVKTKKRLLGLITNVFSLVFCLSSGMNKNVLHAFKIASNPKCNGYERSLASLVYK